MELMAHESSAQHTNSVPLPQHTGIANPAAPGNAPQPSPTTEAKAAPFPEEMLGAIISTFIAAHTDDSDEKLAQALVFNAGRLAWRMRESGLTTEFKSSVSDVVTAADRAAERFVAESLAALRPDDGLLGEEGSQRTSSSGRVWVVDPVDGTYNFTNGSDYWCSALALIDGEPTRPQRVIFGAVHRPAMGYTWFGGRDYPTILDSQPVPPLADKPADRSCLATYLHPRDLGRHEITQRWSAATQRFATVRMLGSASLDLAGVATGQHGCWAQRKVAPWDWLPGCALVEGASGSTAIVHAGGTVWSIAGTASCVDTVRDALLSTTP